MNQYRCETCKNKGCYHHFSNWKGEIKKYKKSAHYAHGFTAEYGCASHSDFQSERDKVLGEWATQLHGCGHYNCLIAYNKLRQAGEP